MKTTLITHTHWVVCYENNTVKVGKCKIHFNIKYTKLMRVRNHFLFTETHAVGLCPVNGHVRDEKKCIFNFFNLLHF